MMRAWAVLAACFLGGGSSAYPPQSQRREWGKPVVVEPDETRMSLGLPFALGYSIGGVATSGRLSHDFSFTFRPEFTWSPVGLSYFGLGLYSELGTLRTFSDFHLAIGVQARGPGKFLIKPVLSFGACLGATATSATGCVELGLYAGKHEAHGLTGKAGVRVTGRHYFGRVSSWAVTIVVELDAGLTWLWRPRQGEGWIM